MESDPTFAARWGTPQDAVLFLGREKLIPGVRAGLSIREDWNESRLPRSKVIFAGKMSSWEEEKKEAFWNNVSAIDPWGWNPALRHRLLKLGAPDRLLPSEAQLEMIRRLANRQTTIEFNRLCGQSILPVEFTSLKKALDFYASHPGCWMKAPWSSSGRGVLNTAGTAPQQVEEWIRGTIRRQGAVLAELPVDKSVDCASEWWITDLDAVFLGLSAFETSSRGKYIRQYALSQEELRCFLAEHLREGAEELDRVIELQRRALRLLFLPYYTGPLGIDMMIDKQGNLHPCIEINLRRTMGMMTPGIIKAIRSLEKK